MSQDGRSRQVGHLEARQAPAGPGSGSDLFCSLGYASDLAWPQFPYLQKGGRRQGLQRASGLPWQVQPGLPPGAAFLHC